MSFIKEFSDAETISVLSTLATAYDSINGSLTTNPLVAAIQKSDWATVIGWDLRYSDSGRSASDVIAERQLQAFFSKLQCLPLGVDKEQVAYSRFMETERACKSTNEFFASYDSGRCSIDPSVASILLYTRLKIAEVLGPVPKLSELRFAFGPGATTSVIKRNACARVKLSAAPSCSTNMIPILGPFLRALPQYASQFTEKVYLQDGYISERVTVEIHDGRLGFVDKDAKTKRSTITEPTLNAMAQRGYGGYIAKRMRRVGIDLKDQTRNQRLARQGSIKGDLATVDARSASDTISRVLVDHLLPFDWYTALDLCRTSEISYKGSTFTLEKFSSMGNGYTFELESLIFWALAKTTCEHMKVKGPVSIFGDDLILPVEAYPLLKQVYSVCGFEINAEKSYASGPFRESCGKDYFNGIDVRPKYVKDNLSFSSLFDLHNHFVRNYDQDMASCVLEFIPEHIRLWGPDGFGDGHLIGVTKPKPHKRGLGYAGWLFSTYAPIVKKHKKGMPGDSILPVYSIYASGATGWDMYNEEHAGPVWPCMLGSEASSLRIVAPLPSSRDNGSIKALSLPDVEGYKRISIYTLSPVG